MIVTIHKLTTRCRLPRGFQRSDTMLEDVARGRLAGELGAQLGPSLDRLPGVMRVKQLRVRVKIPARNLSAAALASAWGRAITLAVHRAIASPSGDGSISSRRYASPAAYKAAMLQHIAAKGLAPCWEFPELDGWRGASPAEAALNELLSEPKQVSEIIAQLDDRGGLEPLLTKWDELSLERLMQAVANEDVTQRGLSLENLVELGHAAASPGGLHPGWSFAGRRQAIRLWLRLSLRFAVRDVWHGLRLLQRCLEVPALLILRDPALLTDTIPFPPWCEAIVRGDASSSAASEVARNPADLLSADNSLLRGQLPISSGQRRAAHSAAKPVPPVVRVRATLPFVLEMLRTHVPSAASTTAAKGSPASARWIVSDCAGMLLMLSVVQRLNLWRFTEEPEFVRFGGARALSFLLAGMGMNLLGKWQPTDPVDPIVVLFAGMFPEPDLAGMWQFFNEASVASIAEWIAAKSWAEALDRAAAEFAVSFASRMRGFRQSSRDAVVNQFIRIRGRVLIEDARVLVILDPSPWTVALHLSEMDEPLRRIEWLDERRVEFVMEGL
jgi:hypothetical protein